MRRASRERIYGARREQRSPVGIDSYSTAYVKQYVDEIDTERGWRRQGGEVVHLHMHGHALICYNAGKPESQY